MILRVIFTLRNTCSKLSHEIVKTKIILLKPKVETLYKISCMNLDKNLRYIILNMTKFDKIHASINRHKHQ